MARGTQADIDRFKSQVRTATDIMDFAVAITCLRESLDLNQQELADNAGVHVGTISKMESGRHTPHIDSLRKILPILELSEDKLSLDFFKILNSGTNGFSAKEKKPKSEELKAGYTEIEIEGFKERVRKAADLKSFGAAMARLREALGISQSQLSNTSRVSTQALSAMENGRSKPLQRTLHRILPSLHLTEEDIEVIQKLDFLQPSDGYAAFANSIEKIGLPKGWIL